MREEERRVFLKHDSKSYKPRSRKTWMKMYLPSKTDAGSILTIVSREFVYSINTQPNTE